MEPTPALNDPEKTPGRVVANMPQISGEAYQHVGRYAGAVVMACFEQIGGLARMQTWADTNPTDFYTKLFPKLVQRSAQVDVSGVVTIDDAIARLENQPMMIADYSASTFVEDESEVETAEYFDL